MKGIHTQGIHRDLNPASLPEMSGRQRSDGRAKADLVVIQLRQSLALASKHIQQSSAFPALASRSEGLRNIKSQAPTHQYGMAKNPLSRPGRPIGPPAPHRFIGPLPVPQRAMPASVLPEPQKIHITDLPAPQYGMLISDISPHRGILVPDVHEHSAVRLQQMRLGEAELASGTMKTSRMDPEGPELASGKIKTSRVGLQATELASGKMKTRAAWTEGQAGRVSGSHPPLTRGAGEHHRPVPAENKTFVTSAGQADVTL